MDLQLIPALIITIIDIIFSGLFSGSEIAFVQSSKVRMEIATARGGAVNKMLRVFYHHEDMFISTLLVGNNIVLVIYGIAISAIINPWLVRLTSSDAAVLVLNTVISTLIILFTGDDIQERCFTGTVFGYQTYLLSLCDTKSYILEEYQITETLC